MTSPSGRHLGNNHSLFKPDGLKYFKEHLDFSKRMMTLHHIMTTIALLNEFPLFKWLTPIVLLLPKDSRYPKIHLIRIINTY